MKGCVACELLAAPEKVPGGRVLEEEHWVAEHCIGAFGVGAFVAKTREHRDSLWSMTDAEAASLGPFLQCLSSAIVGGLGAERVYVTMWVDAPPHHLHLVLWPRYPGEQRAFELQARRLEEGRPDDDAMTEAARRVKEHLAA
jgi:diadenosine tetraphosphate (Ap4A) HIT family hydrolase